MPMAHLAISPTTKSELDVCGYTMITPWRPGRPLKRTRQPKRRNSERANALPSKVTGNDSRRKAASALGRAWSSVAAGIGTGLGAAQRAVSDVVPVLHAVEADVREALVGAMLRHARGVAECSHAQHAATRGERVLGASHGAGVEHHQVVGLGRQADDRVALARIERIAVRGKHHAQREAPVPVQIDLVERAL